MNPINPINPIKDPHANSWRLLEKYNYSSRFATNVQQTSQLTNDHFVIEIFQDTPAHSTQYSQQEIIKIDVIKTLINNGYLVHAAHTCKELRKCYPVDSDMDGKLLVLENMITSATTWKKMMVHEKDPGKLADLTRNYFQCCPNAVAVPEGVNGKV